VNTEEQQLTEMLHRVTPEPPRRVTVEDIAYRLANQAGPGRQTHYRPPRSRRNREPRLRRPRWGWAAAPVLAAASVFVVAGASAGIAVLATSHHTPSPPSQGAQDTTSAPPVSSSPTGAPTGTAPVLPVGAVIPGGPWGARLIGHHSLLPGSLTGGDGSLYGFTGQDLVRIDPGSGAIVQSVPFSSPVTSPPVVLGSTVWVVSSYSDARAVLLGFDAQTLTQVRSVTVPAVGQLSTAAQGVLAAGPDGNLYVAAGDLVAVVNPANGLVVQRVQQPGGPVSSVAVAPVGGTIYVTAFNESSQTLQLMTYSLTEGGVETGSSTVRSGGGGNLVATSGGVWGTLGSGMSESVWFAPGGDLSSASPYVREVGGGGYLTLPTLANDALWIGGTRALTCANPATGSVLASAAIPADHGATQYFGSVVYADGNAYSYYSDNLSQTQGLAELTPPAACTR
jgi:PQQ-like domain